MHKLPDKMDAISIQTLGDDAGDSNQKEVEDKLLELYSDHSKNRCRAIKNILSNDPPWALYYHLTPLRSNLLRWFEFKKDSKVLEIGAGCGAITEELVRNEVGVTALEPSHKKTLINAHRNHSAKNLSLVGGSLAGYKPSQKFDYIVCVGGLGYVQSFFDSQTPYHDVLSAIKNSLANGGKLLLAIDNRLGFKYWAGAREDHTGRFFEGHNGYPSNTGMETFGKKELTNLVLSAGFSETRFFYPYPDYKTPFFVYSDDFYPGDGAAFPLGRLPTPVFDKTREQLFSEQNAMRFIEKNDLYRNFSNSFLVEAS